MEFVLVSAIAGLGFLLSKNNKPRQKKIGFVSKVSPNYKPSGDNIYNNERSQEVWNEQQELANKIFAKSKDSLKTNYMIAGPPVPIFNKVDGTDKTLPVEFTGGRGLLEKAEDLEKELASKQYQNQYDPKVNDLEIPNLFKDYAAAGGWTGISLTGNPVDRQSFFHNNMVPFFGGTAKQNVTENANQTLLENFTGSDPNYQTKEEVRRDDFFQPVANLSNVYGTQNLDGYFLDRYIAGNIRNNQSPVEQIRVGPGLNQGYTAEPSGGVQQANTLDFIMPKTVNELRVKTHPKVSYEGVVIPGVSVTGKKPGKVGIVAKNQPDTFYVNSPDRLFTTCGDIHGPTQRPTQIIKYTNRKTTELKSRVGPAAPAATGSQTQLKPAFRKSSRYNYAGAGPRNQQQVGKWQINGPNASIPNDYGRASFKTKANARMCTGPKMHVLNYNPINKFNQAPEKPNVRHTRRMNVVGNNRWSGNFQSSGPNKGKVYDPNDVPRTTIKEQNIDNNHGGFFQNSGPNKGHVYDPNDLPRTTIKEQNIDNSYKETSRIPVQIKDKFMILTIYPEPQLKSKISIIIIRVIFRTLDLKNQPSMTRMIYPEQLLKNKILKTHTKETFRILVQIKVEYMILIMFPEQPLKNKTSITHIKETFKILVQLRVLYMIQIMSLEQLSKNKVSIINIWVVS